MERFTRPWRRELWSRTPGDDVLEVGVGTGLNMPFYPAGSRVEAIDVSDKMLDRARARTAKLGASVDLALMDVQHLEFPESSFNCVVATFVFCSVPDPLAGLAEVRRVLKPGGTLLLLEHVRSENRLVGRLMDALNPLAVRITGANVNRRTVETVRAAGFDDLAVSSRMRGIVRIIQAKREESRPPAAADR